MCWGSEWEVEGERVAGREGREQQCVLLRQAKASRSKQYETIEAEKRPS